MTVWKWVCSTVLAGACFNAALIFFAIWLRTDLLNTALHDAKVTSATISNEVETALDRVDRTLSGIGEVLRAYPDAQEWRDPYAHRLLIRRHAISPSLRSLFLVGADGTLRNSSFSSEVEALDVSDRDYFIAQVQGQRDALFIGHPIQSRRDGQWVIPISRALEDNFGSLQMVVAGAMSPSAINDLISAHALSTGYRLAILLPDGTPIGCLSLPDCAFVPDDQNPNNRKMQLPQPFFPEQRASGASVAFLPGGEGPGAFSRGATYGVIVAVVVDRASVLAPWRQKLPFVIGLAVTGSAGIAAVAFVLFRQVRRKRMALLALEEANAFLELKVAERTRELSESEEYLRSFIMAASDAVIIIDQSGNIRKFNPAASHLFGYEMAEVVGHNVKMLMPAAYSQHHDTHLKLELPSGQRSIGRGREMIGRRKDGSEFPIELTVGTHTVNGISAHVGVIRDITERKAQEEVLRSLANTDGLTGILNRRSFTEEGDRLFSLSKRHGRNISVLMIDADHFKSVNDTYGHDVGDIVLKKLAATVSETLRNTDLFGRLGGEEFAAILPETDEDGADDIAKKIIGAIRALEILLADGRTIKFTVSIGIGCDTDVAKNLDALLKEADTALYAAKQSGRNRAVRGSAVPAAS